MNGIVASEEEDEERHEATGHAEREQEGSETDGDADDPTNAQETRGLAFQTDELTGHSSRSFHRAAGSAQPVAGNPKWVVCVHRGV